VLAAGAASRFGAPKQRLLLDEVVARVRASQAAGDLVVVAGAYELDLPERVVRCDRWADGPGASLRCGLRAVTGPAALVVLADGPDLAPDALDRVAEAWRRGAGPVVAASYGGRRSHPVVLDRSVWDAIPDEGARALEPALVACDDLGDPGDVDTPDDLPERLRS